MVAISLAATVVASRLGPQLVEQAAAQSTAEQVALFDDTPPAAPEAVDDDDAEPGVGPATDDEQSDNANAAEDDDVVAGWVVASPVPEPAAEVDGEAEPPSTPGIDDAANSDDGGVVDVTPQSRGQRALEHISYPWAERLPGWQIEFLGGRPGLFGLTKVDQKRIEIYVRDDQSEDLLVHIIAHEIGHAVDVTLNDGPDRRRWQEIRGVGDEPWWPDSAASDFETGAGDFAEVFAYWQVQSDNYRSKLGPKPDEAQLRLMAELAAG